MSIIVVCPGCKKSFKVSDKYAGKSGACPNPDCKATIKVPRKVSHTRHSGCQCPMCRGLHLANQHGVTNAEWNQERVWERLTSYHRALHGPDPPPKVKSKPTVQATRQYCEGGGCSGGNCGGGRGRSGWYPGKLLGR